MFENVGGRNQLAQRQFELHSNLQPSIDGDEEKDIVIPTAQGGQKTSEDRNQIFLDPQQMNIEMFNNLTFRQSIENSLMQ